MMMALELATVLSEESVKRLNMSFSVIEMMYLNGPNSFSSMTGSRPTCPLCSHSMIHGRNNSYFVKLILYMNKSSSNYFDDDILN